MIFGDGTELYNDTLSEAYLGDIDYFNEKLIDDRFNKIKFIKDPDKRSREISNILYDIIQNIGSTCTKAINIKPLYEKNYKYNHIITKYCNKYLKEVNEKDKKKIKKAIDMAFVGDSRDAWVNIALGLIEDIILPSEFQFVKDAYEKFNDGDSKLYKSFENVARLVFMFYANRESKKMPPEAAQIIAAEKAQGFFDKTIKSVNDLRPYINGFVNSIPRHIINTIFFNICPVKFRSIGEALTVYKQSYKYDKFLIIQTQAGAKYSFDLTYAVMEDIMKVYKDL